jgi:hypothetical protein
LGVWAGPQPPTPQPPIPNPQIDAIYSLYIEKLNHKFKIKNG